VSRDPKRIAPLLARLAVVWERHPDLRLSQIISNTFGGDDTYYVEDAAYLKAIEKAHPVSLSAADEGGR
jgi:hypothetical protein